MQDDPNFHSKKKRKKNKRKGRDKDVSEEVNNSFVSVQSFQSDLNHSPPLKKKKRKHKSKQLANLEDGDNSECPLELVQADLSHPPKKKKKKAKVSRRLGEITDCDISMNIDDDHIKQLQKKKKKKKKDKRREKDSNELNNHHVPLDSSGDLSLPPKQKKDKHRKKTSPDFERIVQFDLFTDINIDLDQPPKKRKRKHKHKRVTLCTQDINNPGSSMDASESKLISTKRKKHKHRRNSRNPRDVQCERNSLKPSENDSVAALEDQQDVRTHETECLQTPSSTVVYENSSDEFDANTAELRCMIYENSPNSETEQPIPRENTYSVDETQQDVGHYLRQFIDAADEPWNSDCYMCGHPMTSKHSYRNHLATTHRHRSHQCPKCLKRHISPETVVSHMSTSCSHKNRVAVPVFHCRLCPLSYMTLGTLRRHERATHHLGREEHFACSHCYRRFTTRERQKRHEGLCESGHIQQQTANRGVGCVCEMCGNMFASASSLCHHKRIIHRMEVFECVCGKTFRFSSKLYAHKYVCDES